MRDIAQLFVVDCNNSQVCTEITTGTSSTPFRLELDTEGKADERQTKEHMERNPEEGPGSNGN